MQDLHAAAKLAAFEPPRRLHPQRAEGVLDGRFRPAESPCDGADLQPRPPQFRDAGKLRVSPLDAAAGSLRFCRDLWAEPQAAEFGELAKFAVGPVSLRFFSRFHSSFEQASLSRTAG